MKRYDRKLSINMKYYYKGKKVEQESQNESSSSLKKGNSESK